MTDLDVDTLLGEAIVTPSLNGHSSPGQAVQSKPPSVIPLPDGILPGSGLGNGAGQWLDDYTSYARCVSPMTPLSFHESAALWLSSVAIARRLVLHMPHADIYPNLYIAWIGSTSIWRKTTALDIARRMAWRVFSHLLSPQDSTPESFLSDLAGMQPANWNDLTAEEQERWKAERDYCGQRGWVLDEFSGLLASAGKDYNAGLLETLLRLYDCADRHVVSRKSFGRIAVNKSYLSLIGASTPAALASHLSTERLWANGWWPRFAMLTPDRARPEWQEATDPGPEVFGHLAERLQWLYAHLPAPQYPTPAEAKSVTLGSGVLEAWHAYNKAVGFDLLTEDLDERLKGTYGRLPTQVLKIAMILAAMDWQEDTAPAIEMSHLARAVDIAEEWRASAHRALETGAESNFQRIRVRILRVIGKVSTENGKGGASVREIRQLMKDKEAREIEEALKFLLESKEVEPLPVDEEQRGRGRPATRYCLAAE